MGPHCQERKERKRGPERESEQERERETEKWFYNVLEVGKKKKVYLYPQKNKMLGGEMAEKED